MPSCISSCKYVYISKNIIIFKILYYLSDMLKFDFFILFKARLVFRSYFEVYTYKFTTSFKVSISSSIYCSISKIKIESLNTILKNIFENSLKYSSFCICPFLYVVFALYTSNVQLT